MRSKKYKLIDLDTRTLLKRGKARVCVFQNPNQDATAKKEPTEAEKTKMRQANGQAFLFGAVQRIAEREKELGQGFQNGLLAHDPQLNEDSCSLISMLSNPVEVDSFINATPAELALLTPYMRFYLEGQVNGKNYSKPLDFPDHTSGDRHRKIGYIRRAQIDIMDKTRRRNDATVLGSDPGAGEAGIKEFSWTWDNKHNGDKTLKASLNLYFGSAIELLADRGVDDAGEDLEKYIRFIFTNGDKDKERVLSGNELYDAVIERLEFMQNTNVFDDSVRRETTNSKQKDYSQLKCVVGWSDFSMNAGASGRNPFVGMDPQKFQTFKNGVEKSQRVIILQFTKYTLDFGEQGQVNLKIEYVGSLDNMMKDEEDSNIFIATEDKYNQPIRIPRSAKYSSGLLSFAGVYSESDKLIDGAFGQNQGARSPGARDPRSIRGANSMGSGRNNFMDNRYEGFLAQAFRLEPDALIGGPEPEEFSGATGLKFSLPAAEYEEKTLKMALRYMEEHTTQNPSRARTQEIEQITKGLSTIRKAKALLLGKIAMTQHQSFFAKLLSAGHMKAATVKSSVFDSSDPSVARSTAQSDSYSIELATPNNSTSAQAAIDGRKDNFLKAVQGVKRSNLGRGEATAAANALDPTSQELFPGVTLSRGETTITYVTAGHLLQEAMAGLMGEPSVSPPPRMSGQTPCNILLGTINPASLGLPPGPAISIGDLPISTEWFAQWIIDNFTKKSPPTPQVDLRDFCNRFFNGLIAPLLNKSFSDSEKGVKIYFDMTTVSYPATKETDLQRMTANSPSGRGRCSTTQIKTVSSKGNNNLRFSQGGKDAQTRTFFVVYATSRDSGKLKGNYEADKDKGIFHFEIGADRGLVKKYTFKEKKMPHLRAYHIENNNQGSALVMPLDLELTMVGNSFFRNGAIIFVSAQALAPGLEKQLNLGGYYQIVKCENTINAGTYETRLTCMYYQATGG